MNLVRLAWLVGCMLLSWLSPRVARADDAELARAAFEQGIAASEAGDWSRARVAFEESQRRAPKASTLFNLALSELRLEHPQQALTTLAEFDALADPELHQHLIDRAGTVRLEAEALLARARIRAIESSLQQQARARPDREVERARRIGRNLLFAGTALAVGAVGAGLWWHDRASNLDDCRLANGVTCREEQQIERQERSAVALTLTLGASAVGLIVTGAVWLARHKKADSMQAARHLLMTGTGAGLRF